MPSWKNLEDAKRGPVAWLGFTTFRLFLGVFAILPLPVAAWIAGTLSRSVLFFLPRGRETLQRLQHRYGNERGRLIWRANARQYGYMLAELAHRQKIWRERSERFAVEGAHLFSEARAAGNLLVITGHLANWEVMMIGHVATFGPESGSVPVKRIHNHYLNEWITEFRNQIGVRPLEDRGSGMSLLRAMKSGEPICFLADQNTPDTDAVWVPFLGETAATRVGPALLAIRGEARVLKLQFQRVRPGYFRLTYKLVQALSPPTLSLRERLFADTAIFNEEIGAMIDEKPEDWLWLHRRWKRKPPEDVEPWRLGTF